jgi:hypothetical protein
MGNKGSNHSQQRRTCVCRCAGTAAVVAAPGAIPRAAAAARTYHYHYYARRLTPLLLASSLHFPSIVESNTTRGGTLFYTALEVCAKQCGDHGDRWIIALTDGESMDAHHKVKKLLAKKGIHLLIVGVDLGGSTRQIVEDCCRCTDKSAYMDASGGLAAIDDAFKRVAAAMSGPGAMSMETL